MTQDDPEIEAGTWRSYWKVWGGPWYPIQGSMKPTQRESTDYARQIYPTGIIKTVYHSDGDEHD
jgi:hypothetical protein